MRGHSFTLVNATGPCLAVLSKPPAMARQTWENLLLPRRASCPSPRPARAGRAAEEKKSETTREAAWQKGRILQGDFFHLAGGRDRQLATGFDSITYKYKYDLASRLPNAATHALVYSYHARVDLPAATSPP